MLKQRYIVISGLALTLLMRPEGGHAQTRIGGIGAPNSTLQVEGTFSGSVVNLTSGVTTSGSGVALGAAVYQALTPTANNALFRVPAASVAAGRIYYLRNTASTFNAVLESAGGMFCNGENNTCNATMTMAEGTNKTIQLVSDGQNWTVSSLATAGAVTASNGLTATGGNIKLGGTLTQNTDVATGTVNGTNNISFSGKGYLGLGTNAPTSKLTIVTDNSTGLGEDDFVLASAGPTPYPGLSFQTSHGTVATPTNMTSGDHMGIVGFSGRVNNTTPVFFLSGIGGDYTGNGLTSRSDLRLITSATERLHIDADGNVGIGTVTPQGRLHVRGDIQVFDADSRTGNLYEGNSNRNGVELASSGSDAFISVQRTTGSGLHVTKPVTNDGSLVWFAVGGTGVGTITTNGTSTFFNTTSDERLKESIRPTSYGLAEVLRIGVRDYSYKSDATHRRQTGVLAQQLYSIFPQAVTPGGADAKSSPWTVDYSKLTPVLVRAIQQQQQQIDALKTANAALQAQGAEVANLKADLHSLSELVEQLKAGTTTASNR